MRKIIITKMTRNVKVHKILIKNMRCYDKLSDVLRTKHTWWSKQKKEKKRKEKAKFESITLFRENAKKTQHLLKVGKSHKVFPIWPHPQKNRNKSKI